jgi:hypothetical protein
VLFTFPSRYWFTIGHQGVFSLGRWASQIPTAFLVCRRTQDPPLTYATLPTGLLPPPVRLPRRFDSLCILLLVSYNPSQSWFGLFPFRSPLLRESIFLSLPPGTKMFQFPGSSSRQAMYSLAGHIARCGVPPFGYLRFIAYLQLPKAFRCLFRPSSALGAKASTVRPSSLNQVMKFCECTSQYICVAFLVRTFVRSVSTLSFDFSIKSFFLLLYPVFNVHQNALKNTFKTEYNMSTIHSVPYILRKEVIQPHLPIRLPCYDFTPIIGPTFDGYLHKWLVHRLQVLLTFVV